MIRGQDHQDLIHPDLCIQEAKELVQKPVRFDRNLVNFRRVRPEFVTEVIIRRKTYRQDVDGVPLSKLFNLDGRIALRSFREIPKTRDSPLTLFSSSPTVLTNKRCGEAPTPVEPIILVRSSETLVTCLPASRSYH